MCVAIVYDIIHVAKIACTFTMYDLKFCAKGSFLYVFSAIKAYFSAKMLSI